MRQAITNITTSSSTSDMPARCLRAGGCLAAMRERAAWAHTVPGRGRLPHGITNPDSAEGETNERPLACLNGMPRHRVCRTALAVRQTHDTW